jgi:hypothetical protein
MNRERDGREVMRDTGSEMRDTRYPESRISHPELRIAPFSYASRFTRHGLWLLASIYIYIMVVFTGVAFLLHGCKMGPDYTRPETSKADSWLVTASTSESIGNLPWWELLKDQELQRAGQLPWRTDGPASLFESELALAHTWRGQLTSVIQL